MKRVPTAELLDSDAGTPHEIARSLADLRRVNRWFGGLATTEALVMHAFGELRTTSLSLLEVAAGAGYVPGVVQQRMRDRGLHLDVTLLDRSASHLRNGNSTSPPPAVAGDALALPFVDNSFDLVDSSLFAHHLSPEKFVHFAGEALRVCRAAVMINDLVRHPMHLALVYAGMPLYRSRITRHDAPASVRQAYTVEEMRGLLVQTSAARVEIRRHYLYRMGVVVWKEQGRIPGR